MKKKYTVTPAGYLLVVVSRLFFFYLFNGLKLKTNYGDILTVFPLFIDHKEGQYLVNDLDMVSTLTLLTDNLCECVFVFLSGWKKTKLDRVQRE